MRNSEFGIILVPLIYREAQNSVGSDSISDRWQHTKLRQFSVGNGFPVMNHASDFQHNYSQRKYPCFHRIKPLKTGVFVFCETLCGIGKEIHHLHFCGNCGIQIITKLRCPTLLCNYELSINIPLCYQILSAPN